MTDSTDEWALPADGWDDEPAVVAYADAAFGSLVEAGLVVEGVRVLDFGCGTGLLTERLVETAGLVDGVDTSDAMLAVLRRKVTERGWTTVRSFDHLDEARGPYDLVVCSSVCAFVADYPHTARRLASLLVPGGVFVQWDWEVAPDDPDGHGLTRDQIRSALNDAGLSDVEVRTAFTVDVEDVSMAPLLGIGRRPDGRSARGTTQKTV